MNRQDKPLTVVSGLAVRDGKILMGLRKATRKRPNLWELPGGKVEVDIDGNHVEDDREALIREWEKEGILIAGDVGDWIAQTPVLDLEIRFIVNLYAVTIHTQRPPFTFNYEDIDWIDPGHAVQRLPCVPSFYLHYPAIRAHVASLARKDKP